MQRDPSGSTCLVGGILEAFFLRGIRGEGLERPVSSSKQNSHFFVCLFPSLLRLAANAAQVDMALGRGGREGRRREVPSTSNGKGKPTPLFCMGL